MITAPNISSRIPTLISDVRYRRILFFFAETISHVIWWDLFVSRVPIWGAQARYSRSARHRRLAGGFRSLAVEMGGVMIKLGQFLSARVDVLPREITDELKGLQDEVPPVPWPQIRAVIRTELGDAAKRFAYIDEDPIAAASLGQAHRATLVVEPENAGSGRPIVIKVQRPHIEEMVRTDLAALDVIAGWLMRYPPIRLRADIPALLQEFSRTLYEELDYELEADNAERFQIIHATDENIYIPQIYRQHSTKRVLVLEDVEALKVADKLALLEAGINPEDVAELLLETYFKQVFIVGFFHADPHPGNIFIRPLDSLRQEEGSQPFELILVDFGMVGRISSSMRDNLRKIMIGVTRRNARQIIEAFQDLGFFLPGADLERIIEALTVVLDRIWGRNILDLARPDPKEIQELTREFRDILFDFPFQLPQDFIYLGRAFGLLSGLISELYPDMNPWHQVEKYGRQLITSQQPEELPELTWQTVLAGAQPYLDLPARVLRLLEMAESGRLPVQNKSDAETLKHQKKMERRLGQLSWSIMGAAGMLSATVLYYLRRQNKPKE